MTFAGRIDNHYNDLIQEVEDILHVRTEKIMSIFCCFFFFIIISHLFSFNANSSIQGSLRPWARQDFYVSIAFEICWLALAFYAGKTKRSTVLIAALLYSLSPLLWINDLWVIKLIANLFHSEQIASLVLLQTVSWTYPLQGFRFISSYFTAFAVLQAVLFGILYFLGSKLKGWIY